MEMLSFPPKQTPHLCWICGKVISLEECKIDEHGMPVHEQCHVVKLALNKVQAPQGVIRAANRR
jgi:hypothetical protein